MINTALKDQLSKLIEDGKINVKYPDGYKQWKKKFDYFFDITKDTQQTLDIMYGPGGGVNNYRGSVYVNSNLPVNKQIAKPKEKPKAANAFKFMSVVSK